MSCCCNRPRQPSPVEEVVAHKNGKVNKEVAENCESVKKLDNKETEEIITAEKIQLNLKESKDLINEINRTSTALESEYNEEMANRLEDLVDRLEKVTNRLEKLNFPSASSSVQEAAKEIVVAVNVQVYDAEIVPLLREYQDLSSTIGGDVDQISRRVADAFREQRNVIEIACKSKEPSQDGLAKVMKPLSEKIQGVIAFKDMNRRSQHFSHLSAIAESVAALGWVTVKPTPVPYVKEMTDAGQFYLNRVLKDFKEKDTTHVDWVKAWLKILGALQAYIKQNYTTGLTWNAQGCDSTTILKAGPAVNNAAPPPPPPSVGVPPPPPPPPPMSLEASSSGDPEANRGALFAEINKGSAITSGLKKVTDDMKTHKNPNLKNRPAVVKANVHTSSAFKPKEVAKKPPLKALQNKKWIIENFENETIVIDKTEPKQSVYVYKCINCKIDISGKVNSVVLDSSKKCGIVFDEIIATFDVINCQSVQSQIRVKAPTVNIDKTDGCQVYLSSDYKNSRIVTAKSSEVNVSIPENNGDYKETAIPEQFVTDWDGRKNKFITSVSDLI
ncbi:DgyrCDS12686 [Dimorphilus gyrociliatus]|uniref:Adenylyl cyclase-associated protein n=1 Tax=Dimorphilus gyrociliatus TaxID=2664684 RepID=A0A7I8W895_9ANNE|nr:DgyrCDS12686 [Dimorphilus gyrociliatus]